MHDDEADAKPGAREGEMGESRPTLAAVAARAGVSVSTASLAFSGAGPVAPTTRDRVLAAARELGYSGPDPMARSLRRGRSGIVGAVVGERLLYAFRDPVAAGLMDGLAGEISTLGSGLLLLPGAADQPGPSLGQVARLPLDAVVFATCGGDDDPLLDHFLGRGVPVVAIDGPDRPDVTLLGIEDRAGSLDLAGHLSALGHRDVAVVTLPLRLDGRRGPVSPDRRASVAFTDSRVRLEAVEEVFGAVPAVEAAANAIEEGRVAGHTVLAGARPTAIVAQSDLLAVGVIQAVEETGLTVPGDVSVVGFDGIDTPWLGDRVLTTVVQPIVEKGRLAGRMVTEVLKGRRPDNVVLPVQARIGSTSGPRPRIISRTRIGGGVRPA
jgi:DNA-binding LacI/PurR family transcriptional regulator